MKKLLYTAIFLCVSILGTAQDKTAEIQLTRSYIKNTTDLKENGLIIQSFHYPKGSKKEYWVLRYYSHELNLHWSTTVKSHGSNLNTAVVSTNDGEYVYFTEYSKKTSSIYITQIKKDGTVKNIIWKRGNKKETENAQTLFCDRENLYMLETANERQRFVIPKQDEKLILFKYDHESLSRKKITLDLPVIEGKLTSYWGYVGNIDDEFYLLNKSIDKKSDKVIAHLLSIDTDGKVLDNLPISISFENKTLKPSVNSKILYNSYTFKNYDIYNEYSESTSSLSGTISRMYAGAGSYGNIVLDVKEKVIYCYGLTGEKNIKNKKTKYDSYYLRKLDFTGKVVWEIEKKLSKDLLENKNFQIHLAGVSRYTSFFIDDNIKLNIWFYDSKVNTGTRKSKNGRIQTYEFSKSGEIIDSYYTNMINKYLSINLSEEDQSQAENLSEFVYNFSPKVKLGTEKYIESSVLKQSRFHHYFSEKGIILTHYNWKTELFKIVYFKK